MRGSCFQEKFGWELCYSWRRKLWKTTFAGTKLGRSHVTNHLVWGQVKHGILFSLQLGVLQPHWIIHHWIMEHILLHCSSSHKGVAPLFQLSNRRHISYIIRFLSPFCLYSSVIAFLFSNLPDWKPFCSRPNYSCWRSDWCYGIKIDAKLLMLWFIHVFGFDISCFVVTCRIISFGVCIILF